MPTTIHHLKDATVRGKRVLLRAGFDVPITDGVVTDTTRIEAIRESMSFVVNRGGILILMAHQGRPKNGPEASFSQKPLVPVLQKLLGVPVHFASDCIGDAASSVIAQAQPGEVVLLENLRFHSEEKKNDPSFARALADLADLYVNDAFPNCHRAHASMVGVPSLLPSFIGFNLQKEVDALTRVTSSKDYPMTLIIAGSKMETKVPVIRKFLRRGDHILVGGCIANTLIAARGFDVGSSKYDPEELPLAQELMLESEKSDRAEIHVPRDVVVATELSESAEKVDLPVEDIEGDMSIFDIGKVTIKRYQEIIAESKLIVWNGPVGVYEYNRFSHASKRLAESIASATVTGAYSVIGGGDTIDFHHRYQYDLSAYSFVSMGGGAMLEFLASGGELPALIALERRAS